ncbi:RTA1-domain-containing protein [Hypoxylon sp. FL1284]|nr:RTA1-domain-containing protein [Hypoxylon sp. FL1284]
MAIDYELPESIRDPNNCQHDPVPGFDYLYSYRPNLTAGVVFCVLFLITFLWHGFRIFRYRRWTSALLTVGALTELIGWIGRTWSARCPYNSNAFMIQIVTLIIGPVFYTAALYVLLGNLIIILGRNYSLLSAKMYTIIFVTCDVISLIIQAVGGAMASMASGDHKDTKPGTNIMVGGVIFQLVAMTIFALLSMDFVRRSTKFGLPKGYGKILFALFISLAAIYARSIFRAVELIGGWTGYLMVHEVYFIALDGALMVLAGAIFLPFDPASTIPKARRATEEKASAESSGDEHVQDNKAGSRV